MKKQLRHKIVFKENQCACWFNMAVYEHTQITSSNKNI